MNSTLEIHVAMNVDLDLKINLNKKCMSRVSR